MFQAPAKLISHHHLQVSEGPSTFSVKQGSEVQAEKPKEIYRYKVKARSVSQALNERENAERNVHWTLPVRGSSQTASTPSLLCTDGGLVAGTGQLFLACFSLFLAIHLYCDSQPPLQLVRYSHVTEFQSMSLYLQLPLKVILHMILHTLLYSGPMSTLSYQSV